MRVCLSNDETNEEALNLTSSKTISTALDSPLPSTPPRAEFIQSQVNNVVGKALQFSPVSYDYAPLSPATSEKSSKFGNSPWGKSGKESNFHCKQCKKFFRSKEGWKIHMERHEGKSRYRCPYCDRGFMAQTHLKSHISEHTNKNPYKCSRCNEDFKYHFMLQKHLRVIHSIIVP